MPAVTKTHVGQRSQPGQIGKSQGIIVVEFQCTMIVRTTLVIVESGYAFVYHENVAFGSVVIVRIANW